MTDFDLERIAASITTAKVRTHTGAGYGIVPPPTRPSGMSDDDWHDGPPPCGFSTWDAWEAYLTTTPGAVTSKSDEQILAELWPHLSDKQKAELKDRAVAMVRGQGRPSDRRAYALVCLYKGAGDKWATITDKVNARINAELPGSNCNYCPADLQKIYRRNRSKRTTLR